MRRLLFLLLMLCPAAAPAQDGFVAGADVSMLEAEEAHGARFFADGAAWDLPALLAGHGFDAVRLRLWHTPAGEEGSLASVLRLAARARAQGLALLLDLHYADTWADPAHQTKPAAWQGLPFDVLVDSVEAYTRRVMAALHDQGTPPAFVQVGNEITAGMLWDDGRVGGAFDTPAQWDRLAALLDAGLRAARDAGDPVTTLLHLDRGGDPAGSRRFFDEMVARAVPFDAIGLSFYPWWHGTLDDLAATLDTLARRFDRDLYVVETAYPWTLAWFDDTHNLVGEAGQLLPGFPATPDGQRDFLAAVRDVVAAAPGGHGRGVFYWAPEYVAAPGLGSPWENLALFDPGGEALPALFVFAEAATGVTPTTPPAPAVTVFPDPFDDVLVIHYGLPAPARVRLDVYDVLGRAVGRVDAGRVPAGRHRLRWVPGRLPSGLYLYRLHLGRAVVLGTVVRR